MRLHHPVLRPGGDAKLLRLRLQCRVWAVHGSTLGNLLRRPIGGISEASGLAAPWAAAALFQVITQRYLKSSTVLTTNLGVGSWGKILDDPMVAAAMLDRLLHRSVVLQIDGDSYRMRAHRARAEALRAASKP